MELRGTLGCRLQFHFVCGVKKLSTNNINSKLEHKVYYQKYNELLQLDPTSPEYKAGKKELHNYLVRWGSRL